VLLVEAAEAAVWPFVLEDIHPDSTCPSINQQGTIVLLLAVAGQPFLMAWNATRPPSGRPHPYEQLCSFLVWAGLINLALRALSIYMSLTTAKPGDLPICAFKGPHGHMVWHYWGGAATSLRSMLPNTFYYMLC